MNSHNIYRESQKMYDFSCILSKYYILGKIQSKSQFQYHMVDLLSRKYLFIPYQTVRYCFYYCTAIAISRGISHFKNLVNIILLCQYNRTKLNCLHTIILDVRQIYRKIGYLYKI